MKKFVVKKYVLESFCGGCCDRLVLTNLFYTDNLDKCFVEYEELFGEIDYQKEHLGVEEVATFVDRLVEEVIEEDLVGLGLKRGDNSMLFERSDYSGRDFYDLIPFEFITKEEEDLIVDRIIDGVIERLDGQPCNPLLNVEPILEYINENVEEVVVDRMFW